MKQVQEARRSTIGTALRVLTFRATTQELENLQGRHLCLGLLFTWIAGMGRYWDNPRAVLLQHLGVGSVVYVFLLAAFLWFFFRPLAPTKVRYGRLLTFISLTSLPAVIYAIPVERFMELEAAQLANVWFLALVAVWRVALMLWYMRRGLGISMVKSLVAGFLPLTLIVTALTLLNLQHVVFRIMGGMMKPEEQSGNDMAYQVLCVLTTFSLLAFVPLLLVYMFMVITTPGKKPPKEHLADQ